MKEKYVCNGSKLIIFSFTCPLQGGTIAYKGIMIYYCVYAFMYFMSHDWHMIPSLNESNVKNIDFQLPESEVHLRSGHYGSCTKRRPRQSHDALLKRWHTDSPSVWSHRALSRAGQTDRWCHFTFPLGVLSPYWGKATTERVSTSH